MSATATLLEQAESVVERGEAALRQIDVDLETAAAEVAAVGDRRAEAVAAIAAAYRGEGSLNEAEEFAESVERAAAAALSRRRLLVDVRERLADGLEDSQARLVRERAAAAISAEQARQILDWVRRQGASGAVGWPAVEPQIPYNLVAPARKAFEAGRADRAGRARGARAESAARTFPRLRSPLASSRHLHRR